MVINPQIHFRLDAADPRTRLWSGIRHFLGEQALWLPAYEEVASWLADNKSRGLICFGTCGLGKSVICAQVLPILLHGHFGINVKVVTANEMNQQIDALLKFCGPRQCIVIDDLGKEAVSVYGRRPFFELCDAAERTGTLLVISTNLRTTKDTNTRRNYPSIETRYGVPTLDRLKAITKVVVFKGDSLRPKNG